MTIPNQLTTLTKLFSDWQASKGMNLPADFFALEIAKANQVAADFHDGKISYILADQRMAECMASAQQRLQNPIQKRPQ